MLQEVLLALSGHASPLFEEQMGSVSHLVTEAESSLLESIGRLASVHRALRSHLESIERRHPSPICRAVASSIRLVHLARFQKFIVAVERDILSNDPGSVGAYDIVPLASLVNRFDDWRRRLHWFWELSCYISSPEVGGSGSLENENHGQSRTGVQLLSRLRSELHTGFEDVRDAASELNNVAEVVWMRQLVPWMTNGSIPPHGNGDFFIQPSNDPDLDVSNFIIKESLLPPFLAPEVASSILFIGRTINFLESSNSHVQKSDIPRSNRTNPKIYRDESHSQLLAELSRLPSPMSKHRLAAVVSQIRTALAEDIVDIILPVDKFINLIGLMRLFFLGGRSDFADALIHEADRLISDRHKQTTSNQGKKASLDLAGIMMKEGEVRAVLNRTWTELASSWEKTKVIDDDLEWAREHFILTIPTATQQSNTEDLIAESATTFNSFLLLTPVTLTLHTDDALDLVLHSKQRRMYSAINSYLLAIRRAHNHLCNLWRSTASRRDYPAPVRTKRTRADIAFQDLERRRKRFVKRSQVTRHCWTISSTAVSMLAELGAFFSDEIIQSSCNTFISWAVRDETVEATVSKRDQLNRGDGGDIPFAKDSLPRDPEVMANAHDVYLSTLCDTLLLTNMGYVRVLKTLLRDIDHLVATFGRLEGVQHNVDLQEEGVYESHLRNYSEEEQRLRTDLQEASLSVRTGMQSLIDQLRDASADLRRQSRQLNPTINFLPFVDVSAIDRLLVRLEYSM